MAILKNIGMGRAGSPSRKPIGKTRFEEGNLECWMKFHVGREGNGISPAISEAGKDPRRTNPFVGKFLSTDRTPGRRRF
jgi:hypothetical protein